MMNLDPIENLELCETQNHLDPVCGDPVNVEESKEPVVGARLVSNYALTPKQKEAWLRDPMLGGIKVLTWNHDARLTAHPYHAMSRFEAWGSMVYMLTFLVNILYPSFHVVCVGDDGETFAKILTKAYFPRKRKEDQVGYEARLLATLHSQDPKTFAGRISSVTLLQPLLGAKDADKQAKAKGVCVRLCPWFMLSSSTLQTWISDPNSFSACNVLVFLHSLYYFSLLDIANALYLTSVNSTKHVCALAAVHPYHLFKYEVGALYPLPAGEGTIMLDAQEYIHVKLGDAKLGAAEEVYKSKNLTWLNKHCTSLDVNGVTHYLTVSRQVVNKTFFYHVYRIDLYPNVLPLVEEDEPLVAYPYPRMDQPQVNMAMINMIRAKLAAGTVAPEMHVRAIAATCVQAMINGDIENQPELIPAMIERVTSNPFLTTQQTVTIGLSSSVIAQQQVYLAAPGFWAACRLYFKVQLLQDVKLALHTIPERWLPVFGVIVDQWGVVLALLVVTFLSLWLVLQTSSLNKGLGFFLLVQPFSLTSVILFTCIEELVKMLPLAPLVVGMVEAILYKARGSNLNVIITHFLFHASSGSLPWYASLITHLCLNMAIYYASYLLLVLSYLAFLSSWFQSWAKAGLVTQKLAKWIQIVVISMISVALCWVVISTSLFPSSADDSSLKLVIQLQNGVASSLTTLAKNASSVVNGTYSSALSAFQKQYLYLQQQIQTYQEIVLDSDFYKKTLNSTLMSVDAVRRQAMNLSESIIGVLKEHAVELLETPRNGSLINNQTTKLK